MKTNIIFDGVKAIGDVIEKYENGEIGSHDALVNIITLFEKYQPQAQGE